VALEASALRVSLLLELLPEGRGQAVVVTGVLEGSEADKVGGLGRWVEALGGRFSTMRLCLFSLSPEGVEFGTRAYTQSESGLRLF
jgi:hypothetical protein